jgi:2-oxo-3-hexenedioate decarboxylase
MLTVDAAPIASELMAAWTAGETTTPPSSRDIGFDLSGAYAVEAELTRRRRASGRTTVGRKVGYANKAIWRALKLETLVWARMYDDTVQQAADNRATLAIGVMCAPRIEPEIVLRLRTAIADPSDLATVLHAIDWIALGFEIVDCPYPDWKFQPADFVAAFGLHRALMVGEPLRLDASGVPAIAEQLARFTVTLARNGETIETGSGKNALRSPALCVGELASAIARQPGAEPLAAGELVSSGTLTESRTIAAGETWTAAVQGLDLPVLTLAIA